MTTATPADRATARQRGLSTLGQMVLTAADRHAGAALRHKRDGRWIDIGFSELGGAACEIARGIIALGIRPGDRVAVLSSTRPEWTVVDCGALCAGAAVVPIYQTNSAPECRYVLEHSGARAVFCEDAAQLAKVAEVKGECPDLEHVILIEGEAEDALSLAALRARAGEVGAQAVAAAQDAVGPDDVATIVYTSGTTGPPKGCMTTHANCLATIDMYERAVDLGESPVVIFMFLPLAHSLARVVQFFALDTGATLAFWQRDPARLLDDIVETAPTHFPSVPRVFEKIHTKATASADEAGPARKAVFDWALATGARMRESQRAGRPAGALLRARHALADRLVLSKVRALFGPNLRLALTGAAPIAEDVLGFFDACGVLVLEGYGMTETCAAATLNTPGAVRFGTVGRPLRGAAVTIADDGEILMRGPNVFSGYYRDEEATRATFDGEWLHSGDLGEVDDHGFVRITGRKKDMIITSSGKNITPTNLEAALRESRWISQAVVYGDQHPYLVALMTLDPEEAPALAAKVGCAPDLSAMAADPRVRREIQTGVDEVNTRFARIEQIKRFELLDHDLTLAAGELTPTLKVKRNVVYDRYRAVLEALYAGA